MNNPCEVQSIETVVKIFTKCSNCGSDLMMHRPEQSNGGYEFYIDQCTCVHTLKACLDNLIDDEVDKLEVLKKAGFK